MERAHETIVLGVVGKEGGEDGLESEVVVLGARAHGLERGKHLQHRS